MSEFSRGYSSEKLASLIAHAERGHWTAELFKLWRPSGTMAADGLRLAFRNDTINLYRKGQSVAKVGLTGSVPWLSVHWKYALDAELAKGPYVRMSGDQLLARDGKPSANFNELFIDWMSAVDGDSGTHEWNFYTGRNHFCTHIRVAREAARGQTVVRNFDALVRERTAAAAWSVER